MEAGSSGRESPLSGPGRGPRTVPWGLWPGPISEPQLGRGKRENKAGLQPPESAHCVCRLHPEPRGTRVSCGRESSAGGVWDHCLPPLAQGRAGPRGLAWASRWGGERNGGLGSQKWVGPESRLRLCLQGGLGLWGRGGEPQRPCPPLPGTFSFHFFLSPYHFFPVPLGLGLCPGSSRPGDCHLGLRLSWRVTRSGKDTGPLG